MTTRTVLLVIIGVVILLAAGLAMKRSMQKESATSLGGTFSVFNASFVLAIGGGLYEFASGNFFNNPPSKPLAD